MIENSADSFQRRQAQMIAHMAGYPALAYTQQDWAVSIDGAQIMFDQSAAVTTQSTQSIKRDGELARLLVSLESSFFEDYGRGVNEEARAGLECFMRHSPYRIPLLGAEESGALVATWARGDECLTLRFTGRYTLDFAVAFSEAGEISRTWGRSKLATVHGECQHLRRLASAA